MFGQHGTVELRAIPAPESIELRLVVIAEDAALASRSMGALIADGLAVRLDAAGGDLSALEACERRPHLLILRHAGDQRALEHDLRWLAGRMPATMIVVVLPEAARHDVSALLSAGADGLLFEQDLEAALPAVVRAVGAGQVSVPARFRHVIQPPALSHRESQVLALTLAGLTNLQIASRLCISESTVKTHLSAAFRRLGVHSRREAAALVFGPDEVLRRTVLGTLRLSVAVGRTGRE